MFTTTSLRTKLALAAGLAIILGGVIVEVLSFRASLVHLDQQVEKNLQSTAASYNQYVTDWLKSKERSLTSISSDVDSDQVKNQLIQAKNSADFDNVFLAYPDGSQQNANDAILAPDNNDPRIWGWYRNAKANPGEVYMDNPTVASATGANVVSLGRAITLHGQMVVLGADMQITDILNTMKQVILPGDGYMFIANAQGNVFAHSDTSLLNQSVSKLGLSYDDIKHSATSQRDIRTTVNGEDVVLYARPIKGTRLHSVIVVDRDSLVDPLFAGLWKQIFATLIVVVLCAVLFNLLCNALLKPLKNVSKALAQIADGNGDLTLRIKVEHQDEIGELANNFNHFVGSLQQLISNIRHQAEQLSEQADQGSKRAHDTASELAMQQQEITLVATAVTEMASATQEIAAHAEQTARASQDSTESTHQGYELVANSRQSITELASEVQRASGVIAELDKHSQEISNVLNSIQEIAEQTNLLALNAAIEAARAGEQGRGFAVVADEVRILSQRTHSSTDVINKTITTLQRSTAQAVAIMQNSETLALGSVDDADKAAGSLEEIKQAVAIISDMATQIATAAEEQTHVTSEITQNITSIKDVTDLLVEGAQGSLAEANALNQQSESIKDKVAMFKLG